MVGSRFLSHCLMLVAAVILIAPAVMTWYSHRDSANHHESPCDIVLAETLMRDGSVLTVHVFRESGSMQPAYQLNVNAPRDGLQPVGRDANLRTLQGSFGTGRVALWLTRRDATSQAALDFAWWKQTTLIDQNGHQIEDAESQLHVVNPLHTHTAQKRPFPPTEFENKQHCLFVASSGFPRFRAGPIVRLRFHDLDDDIVAEVDVPNPCSIPRSETAPSIFPAREQVGDIEVLFTEWQLTTTAEVKSGSRRTRWQVTPVLDVRQNGTSTNEWTIVGTGLSDGLNNPIIPNDVFRAAFDEPAWHIEVVLARRVTASLAHEDGSNADGSPSSNAPPTADASIEDSTRHIVSFVVAPPKVSRD